MTGTLGPEKRSSRRFALSVPLAVGWQEPNGESIEEAGIATEVSAGGAVIDMARFPSAGSEVSLLEKSSNQKIAARVVRVQNKAGRGYRVFVQLSRPGERFWGLDFRLKKSTADLVELEQALTSGNTDPQVLREFRDAVDYIRKAAWVVQEWQERQSHSRDVSTILPLLMFERIRRTTQLCKVIAAEIQNHAASAESLGVGELSDAIEDLRTRLDGVRKA
ncbi:MAG TPA: hypothetical protein VN727_04040 [Candidatus Binatia bacterium]|jgi:hypothetical protein|nr:hypothetical protein [Candidatus Binatia bacterium]